MTTSKIIWSGDGNYRTAYRVGERNNREVGTMTRKDFGRFGKGSWTARRADGTTYQTSKVADAKAFIDGADPICIKSFAAAAYQPTVEDLDVDPGTWE